MYMKCINNLQPRHLDTVFLFFFLFNKKKKSIHVNLIGIPKIEMVRLLCGFCSLLRADESLKRRVPQLRCKVSL